MNAQPDFPPKYAPDLFVDRTDEIALVNGILDDLMAEGDTTRTIIWVGEHGAGKSWLLQHLQAELEKAGRADVVRLNLADYAAEDPGAAVKAILGQVAQAVRHEEDLPGETAVEMSRTLMERLAPRLAAHPLVVLVDSVYESDWALLAALEDYLLGPLAIQPRVLLILTGRGRPYPFKTFELRTRVVSPELRPLPLPFTREQLRRQQKREPENVEAIYELSGGNPLVNGLLAQYADSGQGIDAALEELIEKLPVVVGGAPGSMAPEQRQRLRQRLEALCVLRTFDDPRVGPMLAAYYRDPMYASWPFSEGRRVRDELVDWGFAVWDVKAKAYRISEPLRTLLQAYLRRQQPDRWQTLNCAAYKLYQEWADTYTRSATTWRAEAEYHKNQPDFSLARCGAAGSKQGAQEVASRAALVSVS